MTRPGAARPVDAVVIGAGIAGIATAWSIARLLGETDTILVDPRPPLSLTSNRPEANYRSWWPQRPMVELAERSIALIRALIEDGASIPMTDRGYLYVTLDADTAIGLPDLVARYVAAGQGSDGADILDAATTRARYPHLSPLVKAALHARNAGSLDTVALGRAMLERARARGVRLVTGRVVGIDVGVGGPLGVTVTSEDGSTRIEAERVIVAAGPFAADVATLAGIDLPLDTVLRQKVLLRDTRRVVPRDAPFTIGLDPIDGLPPGVHVKPDDSVVPDGVKLGWARDQTPTPPVADPACPPTYPREVLGRAGTLIPGLLDYLDGDLPIAAHDGGFYARTPDGLPLVGGTTVEQLFVCAGLAGFGAMMAPAAGEIAARLALGHGVHAPNPFDPLRPQPAAGDAAGRPAGRPGEL